MFAGVCGLEKDFVTVLLMPAGYARASMELRHLRYFVAVAEDENVTRAAARLRVSQPSLSRQILDLEEELQLSLFEHKAKAVRLTEAGRTFLVEARAVLQRAAEAVRAVKAVGGGQGGELHLGYAPSLTTKLLPQALRLFSEEAKGVRVVLHDCSTEEMIEGLRSGDLQLAMLKQPSDRSLRGLVFDELVSCAVCVATNRIHPLARKRKVGLQDLAGQRMMGYSRNDYPEYHEWLASLFVPAAPPGLAEEHDSSSSLIAAVEAGRGVAIVQRGFEFVAGPRLRVRALSPAPSPVVVGVAYRNGKLSAAGESFVAALRRSKSAR